MIEVHRENCLRIELRGGADDRLDHWNARIRARASGDLDDKRRGSLHMAAEESQGLFHIVDVVGAYCELTIGDPKERGGGHNHVSAPVHSRVRLKASYPASVPPLMVETNIIDQR